METIVSASLTGMATTVVSPLSDTIVISNCTEDTIMTSSASAAAESEVIVSGIISDVDIDMERELLMEDSDASLRVGALKLTKHQRKRRNLKKRIEERNGNGGISGEAGSTPTGPSNPQPSLPIPDEREGKRPRAAGDTPPDVIHGNKKKKTFSTVAQDGGLFRMGVADQSNSEGMTEVKRDLLCALIHNEVIQTIEANDFIPLLRGHFPQGNILVFNCANETTKQWLKLLIERLNTDWEGSKLFVVENPMFTKIKLWLPGPLEEPPRIFKLLEKLNVGLETNNWRLTGRVKVDNKGQLLFILIDAITMKVLEKMDFKIQFILNSISVKIAADKQT